jgi:hypothetical protein
MHLHDDAGFSIREPAAKKVHRSVLTSLGPHHEWSGDGHDKLAGIGFPIWGVCDKWSSKWLGLWVVPNNRLKKAIALLFLQLVKEQGGMPLQMSTDCGSETTEVFGLANALRYVLLLHHMLSLILGAESPLQIISLSMNSLLIAFSRVSITSPSNGDGSVCASSGVTTSRFSGMREPQCTLSPTQITSMLLILGCGF